MRTLVLSFAAFLATAVCANEVVPQDQAAFLALTPLQRRALPLALKLRFAKPASAVAATSQQPAGPLLQSHIVSTQPGGIEIPGISAIGPLSDMAQRDSGSSGPGDTLLAPHGFVEGSDTAVADRPWQISAVPPAPILNTFSFPFRAVVKMLMGFDGDYYVCSAGMANRYFLFSAGHCVYNWDPNEDGNTADRQWADEIWVFPGQTDQFGPFGSAEAPYGEAAVLEMYAYTGWTQSNNIYYDQAFVRIDRPFGDRVGWFGYETNVGAASLNFSGYPVELPYVPGGEARQYPGYDAGNVVSYDEQRIHMAAYTYGGHSGGPVWRYDGTNRYLQGMNSTSTRVGSATAARITNQAFNDIQAEINEPRQEFFYADLGEWTRWTASPTKALYTPYLLPQESVSITYNVGNLGFAATGTITVDFYLVWYPSMDPRDGIYIGTRTLPSLAPNTWYRPDATLPLPASVGGGYYYVAWFARTDVSEYWSASSTGCAPYCNNQAVIDDNALVVAYSSQRSNLSISSMDASSKFLQQGESIVLDGSVVNSGNFPAPNFWVGAYLSTDAACSPAQDRLLGYVGANELLASASSAASLQVTIPADAPVGLAKLCLYADDTYAVTESSETDNAMLLSVYIEPGDALFADSFDE